MHNLMDKIESFGEIEDEETVISYSTINLLTGTYRNSGERNPPTEYAIYECL